MLHRFQTSMRLPRPRREVLAFFADAANLQRMTPPEVGFEMLTPQPIQLTAGAHVEYKLRLLGVPVRWQTRIARWDPPHEFVDEQLQGPYKLWVHTHRFQEKDGMTTMADEVQYRLPFWPLGEVADPLVRAQLQRIFRYRQEVIHKYFGEQGP